MNTELTYCEELYISRFYSTVSYRSRWPAFGTTGLALRDRAPFGLVFFVPLPDAESLFIGAGALKTGWDDRMPATNFMRCQANTQAFLVQTLKAVERVDTCRRAEASL